MRAKARTRLHYRLCRKWRDMGDAKDKHQPGAVPIPCYWPAALMTSAYSSSDVSQGLEPPTSAT